MYLVRMDQLTRDAIAAAAAAHQELGRDYDGAVAESLVERIGEEIDRRVEARLGPRSPRKSGAQFSPAVRPSAGVVTLALGSMAIGALLSVSILDKSNSSGGVVALIWIVIGVINVVYARRQ